MLHGATLNKIMISRLDQRIACNLIASIKQCSCTDHRTERIIIVRQPARSNTIKQHDSAVCIYCDELLCLRNGCIWNQSARG